MSKKKTGSSSSKASERDASPDKTKTLKVKPKTDKELNFEAWLRKKEKKEIGSLPLRVKGYDFY